MNKTKTFAVGIASAVVGSLALAAPAMADSTSSGAYSQTTSNLTCTGQVQDDGDGGTLSVTVAGMETRPSDKHFRTWRLKTRLVAQEKTYNGSWKNVARTGFVPGQLGPAYSNGTTNYSSFTWGGSAQPTLSVSVAGFDDLFRAKVVTKLYDDEDVMIKRLVTRDGQCRL